MHCANTGTSQHSNRRFWHHRHVDTDNITLAYALLFQRIGKTAHFLVQLLIRQSFVLSRVVAFPNDRDLVATGRQMAINTVGRNV
ncbi:Uncharacterised protein [Vibrio cholerae]|uniref:Uncharacterized protein n=1 Tax=Vibrio cholerae TaxID=666 RepID=A0A656AS50_VIBCL|nr:Uncharacterised protein [Vibrio cholerae]CSB74365.1 Uncharacterised protein [Vibrio cholerae]CSB86082.1 Uncharacterised protein [Vibrio cholerae]CSC17556.1 Uncharacterised protein [Vibrio cholerae]CSD31141.1 Uncharacterised protein [Vibrio cholerae]